MKSESKMFNVMLPNSDFYKLILGPIYQCYAWMLKLIIGPHSCFIATSGPIFGFGNFVGPSAKISSRPGNVIAGA